MIASEIVKRVAREVGFDACGITPAGHLPIPEERFDRWLEAGHQGSLSYMTRHREKRFDASRLVEGARTVLVCLVSYKSPTPPAGRQTETPKIASYACNADYHRTIKQMLGELLDRLQQSYPLLKGRCFVDTAPLAEKSYAVAAGLGWIGRNSLLIAPPYGSFVHLGELVVDDAADCYDSPFTESRCGSCRACIERCPNRAIGPERTLDTRRCIACRTIESDEGDPIEFEGWIFGCDLCQQVCPYNQQAPQHTHPAFDPLFDPQEMTSEAWLSLDEEQFQARFGATPMVRAGLQRIQKRVNTLYPHTQDLSSEP